MMLTTIPLSRHFLLVKVLVLETPSMQLYLAVLSLLTAQTVGQYVLEDDYTSTSFASMMNFFTVRMIACHIRVSLWLTMRFRVTIPRTATSTIFHKAPVKLGESSKPTAPL